VVESVPKKIGLLLPSLKFGGAERVALNLAKAFKAAGVQVEILLMSNEGEFLCEAQKQFTVIDLNCNKTYKLPGKLFKYLIKNRPDVLVSSFWKLNLCACLANILFPRVTLLLWEHSPPSKSKNSPTWLYAITASVFYQMASKVVVVSTGVYKDIDRWTVGLRRKLVVIFNPITPPEPLSLVHLERRDQKQVLWVGRLDDPKNPGLLLEAFALLPVTCNAKLVFVGDGRLRLALEQRCSLLELDSRVSFLGYLENPYAVMAVSDLLVVSSDREGLPSVIVEAMYCGLRVVSTNCTAGVNDILLNNRYGTIVPCRNEALMAKAIETELQKHHIAEDQINGAQRFLPQVVAQQFFAAMRN
jgi:glycosyltransferase involved in cell wall biosynthesis